MEAIKKKLAALKQERDEALDKVEEANKQKKEAELQAEEVNRKEWLPAALDKTCKLNICSHNGESKAPPPPPLALKFLIEIASF